MNELQIFQNRELGELGILERDGKPYFPATTCARILGYVNPQKAIRTHCKGVTEMGTPTNGSIQIMKFISEGDLYRLITHSRLPAAERFEAWVFDEVLPTIRRTGGYGSQGSATEQLAEWLARASAALARAAVIMAAPPGVEPEEYEPVPDEPEDYGPFAQEKEPTVRHYCRHRKRKRSSKLLRLDDELRERVDEMILSGDYTYIKVVEYLREAGFHTSTSAVGRYAQMLDE